MTPLQSCGQNSLAYLTAATHGLSEEAAEIREAMGEDAVLPEVDPNAQPLIPKEPLIQMEDNWPLLTVSKGFFEGVRAARGAAGAGGAKGAGTSSFCTI